MTIESLRMIARGVVKRLWARWVFLCERGQMELPKVSLSYLLATPPTFDMPYYVNRHIPIAGHFTHRPSGGVVSVILFRSTQALPPRNPGNNEWRGVRNRMCTWAIGKEMKTLTLAWLNLRPRIQYCYSRSMRAKCESDDLLEGRARRNSTRPSRWLLVGLASKRLLVLS
jgi:hypothetical protein